MALGNSNNKVFLSVADGKIVQRVKADTPGAQPRAKKDGAIVYELKYAYVSGLLTGISIRTSSYSGSEIKEWVFDIRDGMENYSVQMMYDSRYATSLLFALANPVVDFLKPITITPWMKIIGDKKKTSCYLKQGEESIDWFFTKDNPNGMPELKQVEFKGKLNWDSFDRMQFLEKFVETKIKPQLTNNPAAIQEAESGFNTPVNSGFAEPTPAEGFDDDLPF